MQGAQGLRALARSPRRFERNLVVIGAGSAGLVYRVHRGGGEGEGHARRARRDGRRLPQHRLRAVEGADPHRASCWPTCARARELGHRAAPTRDFDFAEVMERVQRVVREVEPHDSVERYTKLGVECLQGSARITSPWTVEVALAGGRRAHAHHEEHRDRGGRRGPSCRRSPGSRECSPLTSDTVWDLRELPRRLVVLGGGPIGCELAQCFARLGAKVTQVEMAPRLLMREDPEFSALVARALPRRGHRGARRATRRRRCASRAARRSSSPSTRGARCASRATRSCAPSGRVANMAGYGLEELGIPVTKQKTMEVNEHLADEVSQHLRLRRRGRARTSSRTPPRTWRGTAP